MSRRDNFTPVKGAPHFIHRLHLALYFYSINRHASVDGLVCLQDLGARMFDAYAEAHVLPSDDCVGPEYREQPLRDAARLRGIGDHFC